MAFLDFEKLKEEFSENSRLRLGCWAIILIILFYFSIRLNEFNNDAQRQYRELETKQQKFEEIAKEGWKKRSEDIQQLIDAHLSRIPVVRNEGLARAKVENMFSSLMKKYNFKKNKLDIERVEKIKGASDVYRVVANVKSAYDVNPFISLLYDLENSEQEGAVVKLVLSKGKNSQFELSYAAYFQIKE
jgi:hypothetical protein